jgi:transposase
LFSAVERAQIPSFTAFADGIRLWHQEILAYFDEPTSNGYADGVINKVKKLSQYLRWQGLGRRCARGVADRGAAQRRHAAATPRRRARASGRQGRQARASARSDCSPTAATTTTNTGARCGRAASSRSSRAARQSTAPVSGAERWVVERGFAWLHNFRRLRTRYERIAELQLALLELGCAVIC